MNEHHCLEESTKAILTRAAKELCCDFAKHIHENMKCKEGVIAGKTGAFARQCTEWLFKQLSDDLTKWEKLDPSERSQALYPDCGDSESSGGSGSHDGTTGRCILCEEQGPIGSRCDCEPNSGAIYS